MNRFDWRKSFGTCVVAFVAGIGCGVSAQAKDIVVGQSTALTGVLASSGEPMRLGAQIHFDMVNAAGGIKGQKIRFISKDDQYKVAETVRNITELIEKDGAVVLLGGSGTANNEAVLKQKLLANAGLAMVGPRTGGSALREPFNPHMFHIRASYAAEVNKAIEHFTSVGFKKIGIVYQNDAFGTDGLLAAQEALKRRAMEPVFLAAYERNSTKMTSAVQTAIAHAPQAILLLTTSGPTAEFVKLFRDSSGMAQLIALSVNDAAAIIKEIGVKAAHGLAITSVFPSPRRTDFDIVKEYQSALKKFGPKDALPSSVSLEGFIVAKVIVEALRRSGPNPSPETVMKSLEALGNTDIGGFRINFGPKVRAGSHYVDITIIDRNGAVLR